MPHEIIVFLNLFLAGLLAGEELLVCYGLRLPLSLLDDQPHIELRQNLILKLRVLVPSIFVPTLLSAIAAAVQSSGEGLILRCAALLGLLIWSLATFLGTVPINQAVLTWEPDAPPDNWKLLVSRWEQLDVVRCWAAMGTFIFLLLALAITHS